jgi:methionine-S-sulfoxide reductase
MQELFREQPGITNTEVGYSGGENVNPTYEYHPGHAEAIKITYDPKITSYENLLDFFFRIHDPTTKDRQGNDIGSSYRSAIFYHTEDQRKTAEAFKERLNKRGKWGAPVVTQIVKTGQFWKAEDYHQDYLVKNPKGYTCHFLRPESVLGD